MAHETAIRVRYEETDRMGVVYYGNYLVWFEVARTEFFRKLGLPYRELEEKDRLHLMVAEAKCSYKAPATYDDLVRIETEVSNIKNSSISFSYRVYCGQKLLATGETTHVFTDQKGKPVRIPEKVRSLIAL